MINLKNEKVVIATHNKGKVPEIKELLMPIGVSDVTSAGELGISDIEETGTTFEENALIKAEHVFNNSGFISISDDSGICISAMNEGPGIYSARFAKKEGGFIPAMHKIIECVKDNNNFDAYFVCVLALVGKFKTNTGKEVCIKKTYRGIVEGKITTELKGDNGFGFDPIFIPNGYNETFGEMDPNYKKDISHRANAFQLLLDDLA